MNVTSIPKPTIEQELDIYSPVDGGFANSDGIIFSSLNGGQNSVLRPNPVKPADPMDTVSTAASNINNVIDNFDIFSPFNSHAKPEQPQSPSQPPPSSSFQSSGFTFAPLLIISALPPQYHQPNSNSSTNQIFGHETFDAINPNPTSSTFSSETSHSAQLTSSVTMTRPPAQCGISNYTHSRVVGGAITQIGIYLFRSFFFFQ